MAVQQAISLNVSRISMLYAASVVALAAMSSSARLRV